MILSRWGRSITFSFKYHPPLCSPLMCKLYVSGCSLLKLSREEKVIFFSASLDELHLRQQVLKIKLYCSWGKKQPISSPYNCLLMKFEMILWVTQQESTQDASRQKSTTLIRIGAGIPPLEVHRGPLVGTCPGAVCIYSPNPSKFWCCPLWRSHRSQLAIFRLSHDQASVSASVQ